MKLEKYAFWIAAILLFTMIFTRCQGEYPKEDNLQIGAIKMIAQIKVSDSSNVTSFVYRVVQGDSLQGRTFKTLKVTYLYVSGLDSVRDGFGKPIFDSTKNVYLLKEKYDSIPKSKIFILSPRNIDSLQKAGF